ncbi:Arrestin C-terminal-like domain-containing protein [Pleurotus pulmonarius]
MSQVKLTLQAPPNVDFVQGYPGIPPGPGRPQATVEGALEVRTPQGVKAKWITIELRKVETLTGGGVANTFYDPVPGPIKLWEASQDSDYELLRSKDFAFTIRIPESIPPTLNLDDRGAGIKYELVGSICIKGSKGFLRRRKEVISSTTTPIIMSKHELHSTWPVYCQPEVRQVSAEGMVMTVSRDRTCFGPNCAITTMVVLKSERLGSNILRGFEMQLVETMALTTAHTATKKALTQTHETVRAECKLPVNVPLYGGEQRQVELRCLVPPHHACSTVNSARHIDISYNLNIRAFIATGQQIALKLPVVVSSWPQEYSAEAVKLIGPAPGLSLLPVSNIPLDPHPNASHAPNTYSGRPTPNQQTEMSVGRPGLAATFGPTSTQASSNFSSALSPIDEFGRTGPPITTIETQSLKPGRVNQPMNGSRSSMYQGDDLSGPSNMAAQANNISGPGTGRRPQSARSGQNVNRLTITNAMPSEIPDGDDNTYHQRNNSAGGSDPTKKKPNRAWPTAEEEKQRLYEQARAQVERTQGGVARVNTPPLRTVSPPQPEIETPPSHAAPSRGNKWLTAEEEKTRLFNEAQAAVQLTQYGGYSPPPASAPQPRNGPAMDTSQAASPAARMYMEAMSSRNKSSNVPPPNQQSSSSGTPSKSPPPAKASTPKMGPQYMSAAEEKAAMRRFQEAKDAVDRTQRSLASSPASHSAALSADGPAPDPIAYESLYPANSVNPPSQPAGDDLPPPFEASMSGTKISEKERLRRNYEAQDNAARAAQRNGSQRGQRQNGVKANASPPPPAVAPPPKSDSPPPFNATQDPISQAISEKERIRRHYEQQDALAAAHSAAHAPPYVDVSSSSQSRVTPTPPPRTGSISSSARARPPPVPPTATASSLVPTNSRPLTAAEEKALLRAKYEAEEAKPPSLRSDSPQSQYSRPGSTSPIYPSYAPMSPPATRTPPPPMSTQNQVAPPPLMPRPPAEYIQETQEEDARVSRIAVNGMLPLLDHPPPSKITSSMPPFSSTPLPRVNGMNGAGGASGNIMIDTRPFTPFSSSFENAIKLPGPPPPLPSKPAGE